MRASFAAAIIATQCALAQPTAVVDDLEQRAMAALDRIERAGAWAEAERARVKIRSRLEESLALTRASQDSGATVSLYAPGANAKAPAIVIVHSHEAPRDKHRLTASLVQLGFFVLELDMSKSHGSFEWLASGVTPQTLTQRDIRSALVYLKSRADIDPQRIGLIADGFTGTVAAALNPDFNAIALTGGVPDLRQEIRRLRSMGQEGKTDTCYLIPRLFQYASTEELLALIAPRPLLAFTPSPTPFEYAIGLYRSFGSGERIYSREGELDAAARYAIYAWLLRWLQNQQELRDFVEPAELPNAAIIALTHPESPDPVKAPVTSSVLRNVLGHPLPEDRMSYALNVALQHRFTMVTQPGINVPVTVLRPGLEGGDASRGTMIALTDKGREAMVGDGIVREAHRRGWIVWIIDPRGMGAMKTNADMFVFAASLLLGENFTYRQAEDVRRILRYVAGSGRYPTALYTRGPVSALVAAYIAATESRRDLEWVIPGESLETFTGLQEPLYAIPIGALHQFDIPDLLRAAQAKVLQPEEFMQVEW